MLTCTSDAAITSRVGKCTIRSRAIDMPGAMFCIGLGGFVCICVVAISMRSWRSPPGADAAEVIMNLTLNVGIVAAMPGVAGLIGIAAIMLPNIESEEHDDRFHFRR